MKDLRLFLVLIRWDVLRELRRRETLANMILFALLVLFLADLGIGPDAETVESVGPVVFWITVLFAGSVGLSQNFARERESTALGGVLTAPVDLGVFYLAKVTATGAYVMVLEGAAVFLYAFLFDVSLQGRVLGLVAVLGVFTLGYMAVGVVLAAMTTTLRGGGEVILRILLFPLMIPMIQLTLRVSETVFGGVMAGGALGDPLTLKQYLVVGLALDALYLSVGFLLFPKILEE
jgi:heme exporter protein CcmB